MNRTFGLFSTLAPDATKQTKLDEITRLRALARHYLDEHNALVNRLWAIDIRADTATDATIQAQIEKIKHQLTKKITDTQYDKLHLEAIESAKALEIEVHGFSDLSNPSLSHL